MMSSEISLLGATPPRPILRSSTSAPMRKVIVSSSKHASSISASSSRSYQYDSLAMPGRRSPDQFAFTSIRLGEKLLHLFTVLRALADHPGPAGFVGFVAIELPGGALELDRLDAGLSLAFGVLGVFFGENRNRVSFRLLSRLAQQVALRVGEPVPGGFVHQDRYFGGVETGIDAVFRLLVPAEIENAGNRPAVAVNHSPLQRGINLAGRGLDDRGSERLEKIAIDRRNANLEAGEIRARDRLVQIEVKRISVDVPREEDRIHLFRIQL